MLILLVQTENVSTMHYSKGSRNHVERECYRCARAG
jgi:hypothetical protein